MGTEYTDHESDVTLRWIKFHKEGKYDLIVREASEMLIAYASEHDLDKALSCLEMIEMAASKMGISQPYGKTQLHSPAIDHCSFCGKSSADVELFAGPATFICVECVSLLANRIAQGKG